MIQKISQYIPNMPTLTLASPKQMINNVKKCGVAAIGLFGMMYATTMANAGPLAYAACVAECTALTLGGFLPLCLAACGPLLMAPTP